MNEDIKTRLDNQPEAVRGAFLRADNTKSQLELFDANARIAAKADGQKRTEADVDALVCVTPGRSTLVGANSTAKADYEGIKTDTQCLLAKVSLICTETAACARVAQ